MAHKTKPAKDNIYIKDMILFHKYYTLGTSIISQRCMAC